MAGFDLDMDFRTAATARVFQAVGMAFLFVPINTAAYAFLPRDKNNAASGLMNLARNIGGSVGISLVTTMLDRRTQVHLNDLSHNLSASNPAFQSMMRGATQSMRPMARAQHLPRNRHTRWLKPQCSGRPPCWPISMTSGCREYASW